MLGEGEFLYPFGNKGTWASRGRWAWVGLTANSQAVGTAASRQVARMLNLSEPSGGSSHPRVPSGLAELLQPAATEGLGVEGWGYHWHRGFAPQFVQKPPRFG